MVSRVLRLTLAILLLSTVGVAAVQPDLAAEEKQQKEKVEKKHGDVLTDAPDNDTQIEQLRYALIRLPIAAGLASVLAFRPRRRGTPPRESAVIHTQIILAVVGASVMLVVGSSLARAFGIVGAAGLVRYRARIQDPKDAGVMLSTLAIGLASGVGLWMLAGFGTVFVLALLWALESFEPRATQLFILKVKGKNLAAIKDRIEQLLSRQRVDFETRAIAQEEMHYEVHVPIDRTTVRLSEAILTLAPENGLAVEFEEKKEKKG
jgi:uncharacterized membrane protein YhiD involved in acid resistance